MWGRKQRTKYKSRNGFLPAMQWNDLRRQLGSAPSGNDGLRSLSNSMRAENPQFDVGGDAFNRRTVDEGPRSDHDGLWNSEKGTTRPISLNIGRRNTPVPCERFDACFASQAFLDDVAWDVETFDVQFSDDTEPAMDMDFELGLLEAVQDVSRLAARSVVRRAAAAPPIPSRSAIATDDESDAQDGL